MDNGERLPAKSTGTRRFAVFVAMVFVSFLLGFIPMWWEARTRASERDAAQQALRLAGLENLLAGAAIQARHGDYEPARVAASTFFTNLEAELERPDSGLAELPRDAIAAILAERDQTITLLARGDPAVAERLSAAYLSYRQAAGSLPRPDPPSR